jgi:hypothetical protein
VCSFRVVRGKDPEAGGMSCLIYYHASEMGDVQANWTRSAPCQSPETA